MSKQSNKSGKLIDSRDLMFVWRLLIKNLFLLILIPVFAYAVGFVYTHRLTDIYGAKVQLLLKSNDTYDYQDPIYKGLGAYGVYMDVQNQMRVLRSRDLIGEVIDRIDIGTSYYVVGRLKKQEVFETLPFKTRETVYNPLVYENPINVEVIDVENYILRYELNGTTKEYKGQFNSELQTDEFTVFLFKQYLFNKENISTIKSSEYEIVFHSRDYLINKYQSKLEIENLEFTSILDVSVTDELMLRGKVFLDTLTKVYIDYSKRIQLEVNQNTLDNIDKQIDTVKIFINEKERELLDYKNQNQILNPTREGDQYFDEYIKYTQDKRELETRKASVIALLNYLSSSIDNRVLPPSFYIEQKDFFLGEAVGEVRSLQVKLELELSHSTDDNSKIIKLKKEISLKKRDIQNYLENLTGALDVQISGVDELITKYKYNVKSIPLSEQGIANIQRELDVNNNMYLFLLEKKTNTLIARAGIIPQVRVLEAPSVLGVVQPDKTKMLRIFVFGGIVVALVFALLRALFLERLESVDELKEATILNILGGIPFQKKLEDESLQVEANPKSQLTESFRTIRTNLSFLGSKPGSCHKILVSSYFPGEGKTFTSSNLATLIARADKKVILVDFDLHKPKIHKSFHLNNDIGITNYIIGKVNSKEIIHHGVKVNLDVITAGPIAPNASELVLNETVDELISELSVQYDYIIVDTPPFGLLNDTLELLKKMDAFLVVMNAKYTRRRGVKAMEEILSKYDGVSIGAVLNGIKESKVKYYYSKYVYKYTYGYNYGYGYGYGDDYIDDNV